MDFPRTLLFVVVAALPRGLRGYETYVVERDCRSGNLTVPLGQASGPTSAALLRASEGASYSLAMLCSIVVSAPENHRVLASIREIGFRSRWDGSCQDYLQIEKPICTHLYRIDEERHYYSVDNTLKMTYFVSREDINNETLTGYPGIKLTVTAYTTEDECQDAFHCHNKNCIWSGLRCDSHNNCGDLSDEQDCGPRSEGNSMVLIILGVLILLLLLIMCMATLLCSKNESVRRFSNRLRSHTLSYVRKFSK